MNQFHHPVSRRTFVQGLAGTAALAGGGVLGSAVPVGAAPSSDRAVSVTTVFERGETTDYHSFRIPTLVHATDGTLLAITDGRVNDAEDFGFIEAVLKRSTDGGRTWGPLEVVASDPPNKIGSHVPVVDQTTGRIHVLFTRTAGHVTGDEIVNDLVSPEDAPRPFVIHSDDHGVTWSERRELTDDVKLPGMRHYVFGPVHGIQLARGSHAGRLVVVGNHNFLPATDEHPAVVGIHVIYSDDHGETWQVGGSIGEYDDGVVVPNETTVVELQDGTVYFNTRNQRGTASGNRAAAISTDGGTTISTRFEIVPELVTPIVQGSLLEATRRTDRSERIVFSAPNHPSSRENLTLWSSLDGTSTWRKSLVVHDGPAGYSDLTKVSDEVIGVLFENGPRLTEDTPLTYHKRISFARVPLQALDVPIPPPATTPDASGNGNHANVGGTPKRVDGVFGRALEFAGHYVEVPSDAAIDVGADPFTAALWFKTSFERTQRLVHAYNYGGGFAQWWIELLPASGVLRASIRTDEGTTTVQTSGPSFAAGQWRHVAVRRGDQGVLTLYVDGQSVASTPAVGGSVSTGQLAGIRVGARLDGINNQFVGAVDEVYVFGRALNAGQIQELAATNRVGGEPALVHLPLDIVT